MGQQANNGRRRATLDQKKIRAAGRQQNSPERDAILDSVGLTHGKNQPVSGAHGKGGRANRRGGVGTQGAGGGGEEPADAKAAPINVSASTKRARRRT
jgi:hypothetical protein